MAGDNSKSGVCGRLFEFGALFLVVCVVGAGCGPTQAFDSVSDQGVSSTYKPEGAAATPSPLTQGFIHRAAKDYGVSDEEARQALREGALRAYSQEEVGRIYGK